MVWGVERFYMRLSDGSLTNAQRYSVLQNESLCYSSLGSGDARLQTLVHGRKCEVSGGFWFSGFILTPTQSKHAENSTAAPLSAAWHTWKESDSTPPVIYWPSRWFSRFLFWKGEKKKAFKNRAAQSARDNGKKVHSKQMNISIFITLVWPIAHIFYSIACL